MRKNNNLNRAKKEKNDEFYTRLEDIEKELANYNLTNQYVYCPCDDFRKSNFVKYFRDNYQTLGLQHLTATNYDIGNGAYRYDYNGKEEIITRLESNGDFTNEECTQIKNDCTAIITNPPFSKFRNFVKWVGDKKYLIIGNQNAITYKEIFPLIKDNKMWLGCSIKSGGRYFYIPDSFEVNTTTYGIDENGRKFVYVNGVRWFTNMGCERENKPLKLTKHYTPEEYPKFDNYNAINVNKVKDIPSDYNDVMAVPITYIDKYCSNQFEIIGITEKADYLKPLYIAGNEKYDRGYINGKRLYSRVLIRKKEE